MLLYCNKRKHSDTISSLTEADRKGEHIMHKAKTKQITALLICICFIFLSLFSLSLLFSHAKHDCIGDQCETCIHIQQVQDILQKTACNPDGFSFFAHLSALFIVLCCGVLFFVTTPISLYNRLNC